MVKAWIKLLSFCFSLFLLFSIFHHHITFWFAYAICNSTICYFAILYRFLGQLISPIVEVTKQENEGDSIENDTPVHPFRERTININRQGCVANSHMELHLKDRKCRIKNIWIYSVGLSTSIYTNSLSNENCWIVRYRELYLASCRYICAWPGTLNLL